MQAAQAEVRLSWRQPQARELCKFVPFVLLIRCGVFVVCCRHEGSTEVAFIPGRGRLHPGLSVHSNSPSPPPKAVGNGLSSCRLKVHVRSPEVGGNSSLKRYDTNPGDRYQSWDLSLIRELFFRQSLVILLEIQWEVCAVDVFTCRQMF